MLRQKDSSRPATISFLRTQGRAPRGNGQGGAESTQPGESMGPWAKPDLEYDEAMKHIAAPRKAGQAREALCAQPGQFPCQGLRGGGSGGGGWHAIPCATSQS